MFPDALFIPVNKILSPIQLKSNGDKGAVIGIFKLFIEEIIAPTTANDNAIPKRPKNPPIMIKQNLKNTRLEGNARVIKGDFLTFCSRCSDKFDIAFLDPPYNAGYLEKALNGVIPLLSDYGKIFCEHPIEIELPEMINDFHVCKNYRYGKIAVTVYKKDDTADE